MSNAYERITLGHDSSGRPIVVNRRMLAMLDEVERRCGVRPTIVQGAYRAGNGASASAGTHDGGGVLDLRTWNLTVAERNLWAATARLVGWIVWYRTPAQGFDPHMHVIAKGDADLSDDAQAQVVDASHGLDGLASKGRDTSNLHVPTFDYARYLEARAVADTNARLARLEARVTDTTNARAQHAYAVTTGNGWIAKAVRVLLARVTPTTDAHAQYAYSAIIGPDGLAARVTALETAVTKLLEEKSQ
jgi:hypothetical protein